MEAPVLKTAGENQCGLLDGTDRPHLESAGLDAWPLQFITTSAQTDQLSVKCPICVQAPRYPKQTKRPPGISYLLTLGRRSEPCRTTGCTATQGRDGRHPPPGIRPGRSNP